MLRTGQGGRPPPRLYRHAGLPPAAGHRRRHRRRADVPAARGPGQHRPRRRPLPAGDGGTGALRRGQRTTHATGRQRVLHSCVVSVCRKMDVRFSITIRQHKSLRNLIEAIPEDAWTPIPYWMDGAADVAETTCRACLTKPLAWFRATCGRRILASCGVTRLGIRQRISYDSGSQHPEIDDLGGVRLLRLALHSLPE